MHRPGRRSGKTANVAIDENRCPVPLVITCHKEGPPTAANGVKMICSNKECPFKEKFVHERCFEHLENYLVGRWGRSWTDSQRHANLWETKGYTLIGKLCRCPCGAGVQELDKEAAYQKELAQKAANPPRRPRRPAKAPLPRLTLNARGPYRDEEIGELRELRREKRRVPNNRRGPQTRTASVSSNGEGAPRRHIYGLSGSLTGSRRQGAYSEFNWETRGNSAGAGPSASLSDFPVLGSAPTTTRVAEWCHRNSEEAYEESYVLSESEGEDEEEEEQDITSGTTSSFVLPQLEALWEAPPRTALANLPTPLPTPVPSPSPMGFGRGQKVSSPQFTQPPLPSSFPPVQVLLRNAPTTAPVLEERDRPYTCAELADLVGEYSYFGEYSLRLGETVMAEIRLPGLFNRGAFRQ